MGCARNIRGVDAPYGVERYWIVDIDARTLEIYAQCDGAFVLAGTFRNSATVACDVPPGLELRLADIWPS